MLKKKYRSDSLIIFCMIALILTTAVYQKKTESQLKKRSIEHLNYLPTGTFLKGMALGYDEAFADFLWVWTVGYFGSHIKTDRNLTWLTHMLKLTTELDPRYESPYEFAGVILPSELDKVDAGIAFLDSGIKNIPKNNPRYWLQHFYLGFCYMIYKNDPLRAARQFEKAAAYEQSPAFLPLLIGRLYAQVNEPQLGIDIIQSMLSATDGAMVRNAYWRKALEKRMRELMVTQDVALLENAVSTYRQTFQKPPSKLSDLTRGLILPFIPTNPLGGIYYLADNDRQIESTRGARRLRIYTVMKELQVGATPRQVHN